MRTTEIKVPMSLEKIALIYPVELAMRRGLTANLNTETNLKARQNFPKKLPRNTGTLGVRGIAR